MKQNKRYVLKYLKRAVKSLDLILQPGFKQEVTSLDKLTSTKEKTYIFLHVQEASNQTVIFLSNILW